MALGVASGEVGLAALGLSGCVDAGPDFAIASLSEKLDHRICAGRLTKSNYLGPSPGEISNAEMSSRLPSPGAGAPALSRGERAFMALTEHRA